MRTDDLDQLCQQPRFQVHMDLEDAIIKHAPDAVEVQELLCCLRQALEGRYEISRHERHTKLLEAFDELNDQLENLQSDLYEPEPVHETDA